jgi:hypothetical protein
MSQRHWRRRLAVVTAGLVALVLVGGVAYAHWTGSGAGGANGGLATPAPVTLAPASPNPALYPGGAADVALTVSNANVTSAHITSLTLDTTQGTGGFAVDANHAGCPVTALSYSTQSNGTSGWTVPGKTGGVNGSLTITLHNAVTMAVSAPNACQGAIFTVYLAAS